LNVNVDRSLAGLVGLSERMRQPRCRPLFRQFADLADVLALIPKTGVSYPVSIQTPPSILYTMNDLNNIPVTNEQRANTQLLGGLATIERAASNAVVSHYNVRPVIDIFATPQGRDLGGIAVDIRKLMQETVHVSQMAPAWSCAVRSRQ